MDKLKITEDDQGLARDRIAKFQRLLEAANEVWHTPPRLSGPKDERVEFKAHLQRLFDAVGALKEML